MQDEPTGTPAGLTGPAPGRFRGRSPVAAAVGIMAILAVAIQLSTRPIGALPGSTPSSGAASQPGIPRRGPAPDFLRTDGSPLLTDLDDRPIHLADYAGRPLWIVFWATWCVPCQQEAADIQATFRSHASDHLAILAIDVQEPAAAVQDYVTAHGLGYLIGLDPTAAVMALYGAHGLPSHVFVDRDGVIRDRYAGQLTAATMELHLEMILGP